MTPQHFIHLLRSRYLWLPVLFCALLLRSALPMGYMPNADAWSNGNFELTFCTADGSYSSQRIDQLFSTNHSSEDPHQTPGHATCPAFLVHLQLLPDSLNTELTAVGLAWYSYPVSRQINAPLQCANGICGPPLGARAPPEWT